MWYGEHSVVTSASRVRIWALWSDVAHWNSWDQTVEASQLIGSFAVGGVIAIKPAGGPQLRSTIVACDQLSCFTNESRLPLARLAFTHTLEELTGQTRVTHRVQVSGPLTALFARVIGRPTVAQLPAVMAQLVQRAEAQE
jgi:hypothetical protein